MIRDVTIYLMLVMVSDSRSTSNADRYAEQYFARYSITISRSKISL